MTKFLKGLLVVTTLGVTSIAISAEIAQAEKAPVVGTSILGVRVDVAAVDATGFRASKLIGATVYDEKNKQIGTVNDLIVSESGKVNLAIVDVGGFLGIDAKHVVIPSQLFQRGKKDTIVLPGASEKSLKAMPAFHFAN